MVKWSSGCGRSGSDRFINMKTKSLFICCVMVLFCGFVHGDQIQFYLTGAQGDGLLPGNIDPPTSSTGSGDTGPTGIVYDTDSNILSIDILWGSENGYSDLTGEVTLLHLHGPTPSLPPANFGEVNPNIIVNLGNSLNFESSATGGGLDDDFFLSNQQEEWLLEGRTYINVHTAMYDTGELRGYVLPVGFAIPEPSSAIGFGLILLATGRKRSRPTGC